MSDKNKNENIKKDVVIGNIEENNDIENGNDIESEMLALKRKIIKWMDGNDNESKIMNMEMI